MLCLSAESAQCDGFCFHFFFQLHKGCQGCGLSAHPGCFSLPGAFLANYASFRQRQIEPESRALGHCFPLCLSLRSLPPAFHSNISRVPPSTQLERGTNGAQGMQKWKSSSCHQGTALCDLRQMRLSKESHGEIEGNWTRWFLENPFCVRSSDIELR